MGADQSLCRIIIVTGLSGSGKSTALNALEDCGFFCIDNLPILLLPKFLALHDQSNPEFMKLAIGMDMREKGFVQHFRDLFSHITSQNYDLTILFFDAADEVLVKRFSETRRPHPLAADGGLLEGIRLERRLMETVREAALEVIDTSTFTVHKLRDIIRQRYCVSESGRNLSIEMLSFGFKHGLPPEADIVMDVRFLPNPFYLDELRELDGRDNRVVEYVLGSEEGQLFLNKFTDLLDYVIPMYKREGKTYLTIAVGCTGGQHRSVSIVNELARHVGRKDNKVSVRHRDILGRLEQS